MSDWEKLVTISLIQADFESMYSLMLTERDAIFNMAIIPYYALSIHEFQKYTNKIFLSESEATRVRDIRNHIKQYGDSFGKSKNKIKIIDCKHNEMFENKLKFNFLKNKNIHMNLGTYWTKDKHIVGNTQLFADFLGIENIFESNVGVRQYELSYQMGSFVSTVKNEFCRHTNNKTLISRKERSINIEYYFDLNANRINNIFVNNLTKELNLFLLNLLCNMNFVKYILRRLFDDYNEWEFRIEYIVSYYSYLSLQRLKNHCDNNNDVIMDFDRYSELISIGETVFQSKFRNCMMHYGLENKGVASYENLEKPLYGLIENCFDGMEYKTYVNKLHAVLDMMISLIEKKFDFSSIQLRRLDR